MHIPHLSSLERLWAAVRATGPYLAIALMPGGLLILCMLLVVGRRNAIGIPWR